MKTISKIGFILLPLLILGSCGQDYQYPIEPAISNFVFTPIGDKGNLAVDFTDGDGDMGLKETDIFPPFDTSSVYFNNFFIVYEEKVNGQFVAGLDVNGNPLEFRYRIPYITPQGQNKSLKGKIEVTIQPFYYNPASSNSDTIRYKIKIVDRALHESNEIITDEIIR